MAGRTVTREDIQAAAKAYCEATGLQCSIGEDDHKIRFFNGTPGDGDQVVWEEAGQLRTNNPEFGLEFREYLPEPVKSPNSANLPARQGNVPPAKPSAAAVMCRSIGKEVPASAAAPSGHSFSRARASRKRPRSRPIIST